MGQEEMFEKCIKVLTKELPVLRKMNHLTQKDMGEMIGVSRQTITNIESGKSEMKWTHFLAIMFLFLLDNHSAAYLKQLDVPYKEIKIWLQEKRGEEQEK